MGKQKLRFTTMHRQDQVSGSDRYTLQGVWTTMNIFQHNILIFFNEISIPLHITGRWLRTVQIMMNIFQHNNISIFFNKISIPLHVTGRWRRTVRTTMNTTTRRLEACAATTTKICATSRHCCLMQMFFWNNLYLVHKVIIFYVCFQLIIILCFH